MKKRFLLLPLIAAGAFFTLSSYDNGYTANGTGSNGSTAGCGGGGCHTTGATSGITFLPTGAIVLDSAGTGTIVTRYTPGKQYVVIFGALNGTTSILPKFGFQLTSIIGSGSTGSPLRAGTFGTPRAGTSIMTFGSGSTTPQYYGHTVPQTSGGTGAPGSIDSTSIMWTAPAAGTGTITMFATVNAVSGNNIADNNDKWNSASASFTEMPDHTAVNDVTSNVSLSTFPNPVSSTFTLQLNNAATGTYGVKVFDMTGKVVATQSLEVAGNTTTSVINMNNFTAGVYNVVVEKDGVRSTTAVVKQ